MKSRYGDRETLGTIATNAAATKESVEAGDMAREMMPGLVKDLNETIQSNPYDGRPFYITVHEKKDALLTNVIMRRMVISEFRPFPEPSTIVFWTDPLKDQTLFCWSLPHWSQWDQILENARYYDKELLKDILAFKTNKFEHFGFNVKGNTKEDMSVSVIPNFKDRPLNKKRV